MTSVLDSREPYDSYVNALSHGTSSCEQRLREHLSIIARRKNLNAFLDVFDAESAVVAKVADEKFRKGTQGSLAGMVVAVKDVLCMKGKPTTCGSKILDPFESLYDATVIRKLRDEDAIFIGRTNMDEFAMGSSNENSAFGPVLHPMDESRVPGGSSGGSAVAVSAGMATAALGTDTGGSIRQPAALCGIVGLKPTYGRVSRYGLVAFASSFDQIGPLANSTRDAARILQVIAGFDPQDSTSVNIPVPHYLTAMDRKISGIRIGLPKEYFSDALDSGIRAVIEKRIEQLRSAGAVISSISLPHTEYTIAAYYILATAEASSNLARFDGARYGHRTELPRGIDEMYVRSRIEGFGAEVKRRIMLGTYVLSSGYYDAYYRKAQQVRRLIRNDFTEAFKQVDCILTPTVPTTAFKLGEKVNDPMTMYLSDIYTVSANLAGIPGLSIDAGRDMNGLPIGLQLLGKHFDEVTILKAGDYLESQN